jgi:serine protease SohB
MLYEIFIDIIPFIVKFLIIVLSFVFLLIFATKGSKNDEYDKNIKLKINNKNKEFDSLCRKNLDDKQDKSSTYENCLYTFEIGEDNNIQKYISEIINLILLNNKNCNVLIKLNSLGGSIHTFGMIYNEIMRLKNANINVEVIIDKYAASGGYLISCAANKIYANHTSLIGSIGVIVETFNFSNILDKLGIKYNTFTAGKYKSLISPFTIDEPDKIEKLKEELKITHDLFKKCISLNRPNINLDIVSSGETWYGDDAYELELIDGFRNYNDYILDVYKRNDTEILEILPTKKSKFSLFSLFK